MRTVLFQQANVINTRTGEILGNHDVLIEGNRIKEVGPHAIKANADTTINVKGRFLMPGMCDAHVHVTAVTPSFAQLNEMSPSYVTARSSHILRGMLHRGFTTVRDAGGADYGIADAISEGYLEGPRLLFSGQALSQTGGHGDFRSKGNDGEISCPSCAGRLGKICDGVDQVRKAAREELRKGATQIKIMASGGVASPTDHIENTQFSVEELRAIVEEAAAARTYVMAHAYTPRAIKRAVENGIRSIEHGNLIDEETADVMKQHGAFLVPTLSTYHTLYQYGRDNGVPEAYREKLAFVKDAGLRALEIAHRKGLKIAYGTDLLGNLHEYQALEFAIRSEVQRPLDIIQSATVYCAELFNLVGMVGVIEEGALADILVVDGNPLENLLLLQEQGKHFSVIMKDGKIVVNRL